MLLFRSGIILTSFLAGVVALLAPCCISVMLPAYFASGLRRRRQILGMTFVFAAGVATVILPIALGASAISRLIYAHHTPVFATGGVLMMLAGVTAFAGRSVKIPMPMSAPMRREAGGSIGSVWVLGAFSGIATACCAPVLAGVVGLAGSTASFGLALAVGSAYVFGMVAPLAVLALAWDAKDWGGLLASGGRTVPFRLGRGPGARTLRLPLVNVLTGAVLLAMGAFTLRSAFTGPGMSNTGWQVHLTARLNHAATNLEHQLAVLPGWVQTGAVLALAASFAVAARRLSRPDSSDDTDQGQPVPTEPLSQDPAAPVLPLEQSTDDRKSALR